MQKRIAILLLALLSLTCATNAQLVKSYGVKAAYTSASQKFDYSMTTGDLGWKRKAGVDAGVYIEWLTVPVVSVVTQLELRQGGSGLRLNATDANGNSLGATNYYGKVNYLSLPVLIKAEIPANVIAPYAVLGPRIDYLLSYSSDQDIYDPFYGHFKKAICGGSFGIGLEIRRILPVIASLELRYNMDFADSYNTQYLMVRNSSYDVWLGVGF